MKVFHMLFTCEKLATVVRVRRAGATHRPGMWLHPAREPAAARTRPAEPACVVYADTAIDIDVR